MTHAFTRMQDASRTIESRVLEMEVELENVEMGMCVGG